MLRRAVATYYVPALRSPGEVAVSGVGPSCPAQHFEEQTTLTCRAGFAGPSDALNNSPGKPPSPCPGNSTNTMDRRALRPRYFTPFL